MLSRVMHLGRTVLYVIALLGLSGGQLRAEVTDCQEDATGGQTGDPYSLTYQSLVTETTTVTLSAGGSCGVGGSATTTTSEQYYVGYYQNGNTGAVVKVDCRTGKVIS